MFAYFCLAGHSEEEYHRNLPPCRNVDLSLHRAVNPSTCEPVQLADLRSKAPLELPSRCVGLHQLYGLVAVNLEGLES